MPNSHYRAPHCTILITGCSSGIGLHCALQLHALGYYVIASARKLEDVHRLHELGLTAIQLDLNSSTSIQLAFKQVMELSPRVDVLFNNAGYGQPGAVEDLPRDVIREQFETNVFGTLELTNLIIQHMRQQGHGRIIQNSSVLGFVSMAFRGAYNASKHALEALSDTLRIETYGSGIEISLIEPGPIESDFRKNAYLKFQHNIDTKHSYFAENYHSIESRLASAPKKDPFTLGPEAVLAKVLLILKAAKPKPRYYVTKPTYVFGLLKRILPSRWLDFCLRIVMKRELHQNQGAQ